MHIRFQKYYSNKAHIFIKTVLIKSVFIRIVFIRRVSVRRVFIRIVFYEEVLICMTNMLIDLTSVAMQVKGDTLVHFVSGCLGYNL